MLIAGSVLSVLTAAAGAVFAGRHWSDGTAFDADTSPTFGIVVGIEFGVAAIGAGLLALLRRNELAAPGSPSSWACTSSRLRR